MKKEQTYMTVLEILVGVSGLIVGILLSVTRIGTRIGVPIVGRTFL